MKDLDQFTRKYALSKTLRFRLIPIGKTLDNIIKSHILEEDKLLSESYSKVKKIIDEYHKAFIENALSDFKVESENNRLDQSLIDYYRYYHIKSKGDLEKEEFKAIQANLRKKISDRLSKDAIFKRIDKKELIQEDLISFVENDPDCIEKRELIKMFKDFTTYFSGFHENRKNMYSSGEQSSAIAYRMIHENLPKFIDNMRVFEELMKTQIKDNVQDVVTDFRKYMSVNSIEQMFKLTYFYTVMTQEQINLYNAVIEGTTLENGQRLHGLNEYIDQYNRQNRKEKLPLLTPLYKQILSDRNSIPWLPAEFSSDNQVLRAINKVYLNLRKYIIVQRSLIDLLISLKDYDLSGVFIKNNSQLNGISYHIFGNMNIITKAIRINIGTKLSSRKNESQEAYQSRISKRFNTFDSFSIKYIDSCLKEIGIQNAKVENYFKDLGAVEINGVKTQNYFDRITESYRDLRTVLEEPYPTEKRLSQDINNIRKIKCLLDRTKDLQKFIEPLLGQGDEPNKDERFYGEFTAFWNELDKVTSLYTRVRNYITKKPYSIEKFKMNFDNSTLMNGWDVNKERINRAVLMKKDGLFYLAIMKKEFNKVFDNYPSVCRHGSYEKVEYKLLPGANKMLPKVFFSKAHIHEFNPNERVLEIYKSGSYKKGEHFNIHDCHLLIDFFKISIARHPEWKNYNFRFSATSSYKDLSSFYKEVEEQAYKISFKKISTDYIDQLVNEGKLFLFQIYNKDFSGFSQGTPNLHTLYWKMLFDPKNLEDIVFKLNGQAEIFFRKASIRWEKPTHPAGIPIPKKRDSASQEKSIFSYDLIRHRRYSEDMFQLHVPITINYKNDGTSNINKAVLSYLQRHKNPNIIGISRSENHLLNVCIINSKGQILEQKTLDIIQSSCQGKQYMTDYLELLEKRQGEYQEARDSWKCIDSTKSLKEGYLSQAIHQITEMMIRYEAIVILEDLGNKYVHLKSPIDDQIYMRFERMLIDKLNYLADKQSPVGAYGGLLRAYQLTNPFESFQKIGRQNGFLFFFSSSNICNVDPSTGFVNLLDTGYESVERARLFFSKFERISYNRDKGWFELELDYNRFTEKSNGSQTHWIICSHGTRIEDHEVEVRLSDRLRTFFDKYHIDYTQNLKEVICSHTEKAFFEELLYLLRLSLQMNNWKKNSDIDYIISPVRNDKGDFYDSRKCPSEESLSTGGNCAFNMARKGLWMIQRLQQSTPDLKDIKTIMGVEEWLNFIQQKPYLL